MKLVSFTICPFLQRVTAVLAAKRASYDVEYIDGGDKPDCNKPDWFMELSPHGQAPVLVTDDGRAIFESDPITEYVDEAIGEPFSSSDPVKKAQDRAWNGIANKLLGLQCSAMRCKTREDLKEKLPELSDAFAKIEQRVNGSPFVDGPELGMIDLAWVPILHRFDIVERHTGYDFLRDYPKLKQWQTVLLETGIPEKSVAPDFESRFIEFYMSSDNYLGELRTNRIAA